jgi:oligopeptide/dipeptide ABC transporter ATP-binding protein
MGKNMQDMILTVKDLRTYFYSNQRCNKVLNGLSFEIQKGHTLCVVGESGCGKSVTAQSIMRLLPPLARIESGEIMFRGQGEAINLTQLEPDCKKMRDLRGDRIAMIFQDPMAALNPVYTIGYQICENIRRHTGLSKKEASVKCVKLLSDMGIPSAKDRAKDYPHQFSGGMRQRAMIAMAMSCEPNLLIADEPTTALDVTVQAQIFALMRKLKQENETSVMLITHDMGVVAEMADDVMVMYMGYIVESGTAREVLKTPMHPYTKALLDSIPVAGRGKKQNIQPIRGVTPNPYERPLGCQFQPRCDFAIPVCNSCIPPLLDCGGTHKVRCHLFDKGAE